MSAPVVLFVYNRPNHTEKVLDALNNAAYGEMDLYIFSDGWKSEKDKANVETVRMIVKQFLSKSKFSRTIIYESPTNQGLANSVIKGVTRIINDYGNVIVLEDDLVVSKHFLAYMNKALDYYCKDEKIWSISGYSFPMKSLAEYNHDVFVNGRGCCWGWATWKNRWNLVDWEVREYNRFKHNWLLRRRFGKYGRDLPIMLDAQMYTNHNSWAIRWCFSEFVNKSFTVYPKKSYVLNIGNDGSGIHKSSLANRFDTIIDDGDKFECVLEDVHEDKKISKEFAKKYYISSWHSFKQEIRWILIRCGLLNPNK